MIHLKITKKFSLKTNYLRFINKSIILQSYYTVMNIRKIYIPIQIIQDDNCNLKKNNLNNLKKKNLNNLKKNNLNNLKKKNLNNLKKKNLNNLLKNKCLKKLKMLI